MGGKRFESGHGGSGYHQTKQTKMRDDFPGESEASCHSNRTLLSFVKNKAVHLANTHAHTHTEQNRRTNVTSKTREKKQEIVPDPLFIFLYLKLFSSSNVC
jgi:hypothetical protein